MVRGEESRITVRIMVDDLYFFTVGWTMSYLLRTKFSVSLTYQFRLTGFPLVVKIAMN